MREDGRVRELLNKDSDRDDEKIKIPRHSVGLNGRCRRLVFRV